MLGEMERAPKRVRVAACKKTDDMALASQATTLSQWLGMASNACEAYAGGPHLQASWIAATKAGNAAIQRWLSAASKLQPPTIRIETICDAHTLMSFRARVGHLDHRCDPDAESDASTKIAAEQQDHTNRVRAGACKLWVVDTAGFPDKPQVFSAEAPFCVTMPTTRKLINKRTNGKASAVIPWSALRALAAVSDRHLRLIHNAVECI